MPRKDADTWSCGRMPHGAWAMKYAARQGARVRRPPPMNLPARCREARLALGSAHISAMALTPSRPYFSSPALQARLGLPRRGAVCCFEAFSAGRHAVCLRHYFPQTSLRRVCFCRGRRPTMLVPPAPEGLAGAPPTACLRAETLRPFPLMGSVRLRPPRTLDEGLCKRAMTSAWRSKRYMPDALGTGRSMLCCY